MNHISHSTARTISECQQKARFKIEGKTTKIPEAFLFGSAIHSGLEAYAKTKSKLQAIEATLQYIESYGNSNKYKPDAPDLSEDDYELETPINDIAAQCEEIISDVVDYPPEEWVELINHTEIVAVEESLDFSLLIELDSYGEEKEIPITGKPDLVLADHEKKELYIVDNKTAGKMAKMSITEKLQTSIYALYYSNIEEYEDYDMICVIRRILKTKRKKDDHIVTEIQTAPITSDMMHIAKDHLEASYLQAEQIEGDMLTTYGGLLSGFGCSYCEFKDICDGYQAFHQKEGE